MNNKNTYVVPELTLHDMMIQDVLSASNQAWSDTVSGDNGTSDTFGGDW